MPQTTQSKTNTLLLRAVNLRKVYGDRVLLEIPELYIRAGERIGLIGANGSGKTTLLSLLAGALEPDAGRVERHCGLALLPQFGTAAPTDAPGKWSARGERSGGEQMRLRLAAAFAARAPLLFCDEPTANLDDTGVRLVAAHLLEQETFLLVSHDRSLLRRVCTRIWELDGGALTVYDGGYDGYIRVRAERRQRQQTEYERFIDEKRRLEAVYLDKKRRAAAVARPGGKMTPREARLNDFLSLHKSTDTRQRSLERAARNVKARLDRLEVKEKPREAPCASFDFSLTDPPRGKTALAARGVSFAYPGKEPVLRGVSFELPPGVHAALAGANGCGKTTLLSLIERAARGEAPKEGEVFWAPKARAGYFRQGFENLDPEKTALQNVLDGAVQSETAARSLLGGLLLADACDRPCAALSGGERIRLSFAKLLASPANVLLLDEPTNFLDLPSIEALQSVLRSYEGTVLFVSHDRAFADAVAARTLLLRDGEIASFGGSVSEAERAAAAKRPPDRDRRAVLELRLGQIVGQLCRADRARGKNAPDKAALEAQYEAVLAELKELGG